ncbi:MAG: caspase family protein [Bryobacteraceae bacterium]
MPDWAIVIGVDRYAAPHLNLKGAVRDALAVARFLTTGSGAPVSPPRLKLLLSRTGDSPDPGSIPFADATRKNIVEAFRDVVRKPPGRLFVHFSGHGLTAPGITGGEAILPEDYEPADPVFSIRLEGIRDFLRTSKFDQQFFFIDACRNTPLEGDFQIGQFPVAPDPAAMRDSVQQFVFCATLRGVKANEDRSVANDERGVFTEPLLRGLAGEGPAKVFYEDAGEYLVTAGRLLRFVRDEVRARVAALGLDDAGSRQEPRLLGEMGDTETPVVRLNPSRVADVELRFALDPADAGPQAQVTVRGDVDREAGPPVDGSTVVKLPPRDYRVSIAAPGFASARGSWPVSLYGDRLLELRMRRDSGAELLLGGGGPAGPAAVRCTSGDPLSLVRFLDSRGHVLAVGRKELRLENVRPGIYRAVWMGASGETLEHEIAVEPGEQVRWKFHPPPAPAPATRGIRVPPGAEGLRVVPGRFRKLRPGVHAVAVNGAAVSVPVLPGRVTIVAQDAGVVALAGAAMEVVETAVRYFAAGLYESAVEFLDAGKPAGDPVALMVAAYSELMLERRGRRRGGLQARVRLLDRWDLPDVHVLRAEAGADAHESCRAALDLGLPLFDLGARLLAAKAREMAVAGLGREALEVAMRGRVGGRALFAWRPTKP